jgi:hypothetical protein
MDQLFAKIAVASFGNADTGELCAIDNGAIDGSRINRTDIWDA